MTTDPVDLERPPGAPDTATPRLSVLPPVAPVTPEPPRPDLERLLGPDPLAVTPAPGDPVDDPESDLFPDDEPTPLPDVSLLSVHPSPWAFAWAVLYALISGALTAWDHFHPSFGDAWLINGYEVGQVDAPLRLTVSMMLHSGLEHFLGNMIMLVPFAGFTTAFYGFFAFPVILVTLGVLTHWITILSYPPYMHLVGSSGLLFAVFGFWLALWAFVEGHLSPGKRLLRFTGFALMMLVPHSYSPTTSYRAHYIGLGLGFGAGLLFYAVTRGRLQARNLAAREAERLALRDRPARAFGRRGLR